MQTIQLGTTVKLHRDFTTLKSKSNNGMTILNLSVRLHSILIYFFYKKYNCNDFGAANIDIAANNLIVLQSAALNLMLCRSEHIIGYTSPYQIGEGVRVLFRFS